MTDAVLLYGMGLVVQGDHLVNMPRPYWRTVLLVCQMAVRDWMGHKGVVAASCQSPPFAGQVLERKSELEYVGAGDPRRRVNAYVSEGCLLAHHSPGRLHLWSTSPSDHRWHCRYVASRSLVHIVATSLVTDRGNWEPIPVDSDGEDRCLV